MAKASKKRTAGRPPKSDAAPGIYLRREVYFLRYTANGEQVRVTLGTSDRLEAIKRAEELRGRAVVAKKTGRTVGGKTDLDRRIEKYTAEKLKSGDFTPGSAKAAAQAIKHFVAAQAALKRPVVITSPEQITSRMLADYYLATRGKQSEATAQTYATRVSTFVKWAGMRVTTPKFESEAPARQTVIPASRVTTLLELAADLDLKFILLAGFRAGMRRGEIAMARPSWFDLDGGETDGGGLIHIPAVDRVTGFSPKSGRARTIPMVPEFVAFVRENFPDWHTRQFCLRPDKTVGTWIYRFDFRKLFQGFSATHCPELTPHVMRHSFASHLANYGVGIAQLAAWTGDRIATLERHYLHLSADAQLAAAAFSAHIERERQRVERVRLEQELMEQQRLELERRELEKEEQEQQRQREELNEQIPEKWKARRRNLEDY